MTAARTAFEKNDIGWTKWDYQGRIGVVRDDDLVLRSLGLKK